MAIETKTLLTVMLSIIVALCYVDTLTGSYSLDESRHVVVVAVSTQANGSYIGVSADLYVRVVCPGVGHVYVETLPLSQLDLQASTRIAALVASHVAGIEFNYCDFYASIKADSPIVGGPSASGVTAVAFAAALLRLPLNNSVVMTGMIMPDGSVGPVGGVKYKLDAAYNRGAKLFIVPYGQTIDYIYRVVTERIGPLIVTRTVSEPINLTDYGAKIGVGVVPVANIYEALEIFTNGEYKVKVSDVYTVVATSIYSSIRPVIERWVKDLKTEIMVATNKSKNIESDALTRARAMYTQYTYRYILGLLSSIDSNIDNLSREAENMENRNNMYSAASIYFQVLTYAYAKLYLLSTILDTNFIKNLGSSLNKSVYEFIDEIHRKPISSRLDLSIAVNALDRAYEATIYINRSLGSNDLESAVNSLAYASARLYTARLWRELATITDTSNSTIDLENIRAMATHISTLAQNIYAYIISFSGSNQNLPTALDEVKARYDLLQRSGNDLDRLTLGISSISYMYLTLVSMFIQSAEATLYTLNRTVYINLNILGNYIPIDTPLYIEIIENLKNNPSSQIVMLARLSMMLTLHRSIILLTEMRTTTFTMTGSETVTQTPIDRIVQTVTVTHTITVTKTVTSPNFESPYQGGEESVYSKNTVNPSEAIIPLIIIVATLSLIVFIAIVIKFIGGKV